MHFAQNKGAAANETDLISLYVKLGHFLRNRLLLIRLFCSLITVHCPLREAAAPGPLPYYL